MLGINTCCFSLTSLPPFILWQSNSLWVLEGIPIQLKGKWVSDVWVVLDSGEASSTYTRFKVKDRCGFKPEDVSCGSLGSYIKVAWWCSLWVRKDSFLGLKFQKNQTWRALYFSFVKVQLVKQSLGLDFSVSIPFPHSSLSQINSMEVGNR